MASTSVGFPSPIEPLPRLGPFAISLTRSTLTVGSYTLSRVALPNVVGPHVEIKTATQDGARTDTAAYVVWLESDLSKVALAQIRLTGEEVNLGEFDLSGKLPSGASYLHGLGVYHEPGAFVDIIPLVKKDNKIYSLLVSRTTSAVYLFSLDIPLGSAPVGIFFGYPNPMFDPINVPYLMYQRSDGTIKVAAINLTLGLAQGTAVAAIGMEEEIAPNIDYSKGVPLPALGYVPFYDSSDGLVKVAKRDDSSWSVLGTIDEINNRLDTVDRIVEVVPHPFSYYITVAEGSQGGTKKIVYVENRLTFLFDSTQFSDWPTDSSGDPIVIKGIAPLSDDVFLGVLETDPDGQGSYAIIDKASGTISRGGLL